MSGEGGVFGEQPGDRVGAQWSACSGRKQWIGWAAIVFAEPDGEHSDCLGGQGCRALFASLSVAADVGSGGEMSIVADQSGQFRDA